MQLAPFPHHVFYLGKEEVFQRRRKRHWRIECRDAHDWAIEVFERLLVDDGRNFACQSAGPGVFVQDDDLVGFLDRRGNGLAVERRTLPRAADL